MICYTGCRDSIGRLACSYGIKGEEREDRAPEKEAGCVSLGQAALLKPYSTS